MCQLSCCCTLFLGLSRQLIVVYEMAPTAAVQAVNVSQVNLLVYGHLEDLEQPPRRLASSPYW